MSVRKFEALGFDPAPGDVELTRQGVTTLRATVDALSEVEQVLKGVGDEEWVGKSADAFRDNIASELTPRVRQALSSFSEAHSAMRRWVGELDGFQARAWDLELRARNAVDDVQAAQTALNALPETDQVADSESADVQQQRHHAQARVDAAQGELAGIIGQAKALHDEVEATAAETAQKVDASGASAPDEPGLLESAIDALGELGSWIADGFDWLMENIAPIIEAALPYIITALAIASLFTGVLAPIAFGLAAFGVGIDAIQAARGEGSWGEVVFGVATLALGAGLGRIAGRFMRMRGSAFKLRVNTPPTAVATPSGAVAVPGTATATIRFYPGAYNLGGMGYATAKFGDLYTNLPPTFKPDPPREQQGAK